MTMKRSRVVGVAVVTALSVVGSLYLLSSGSDASDDGVPPLRMSDSRAAAIVADARGKAAASERSSTDDGYVSPREYESAVDRTLDCIRLGLVQEARARGLGRIDVITPDPVLTPDGFALHYSYRIAWPDGRPEDLDPSLASVPGDVDEECQAKHLRSTERIVRARLMSDANYVAKISDAFTSCLAEGGITLPDGEDVRDSFANYVMSQSEEQRVAHGETLNGCLSDVPALLEVVE